MISQYSVGSTARLLLVYLIIIYIYYLFLYILCVVILYLRLMPFIALEKQCLHVNNADTTGDTN